MAADDILLDVEDRMDKAVAKLKNDLSGIRTGRANPGLVDSLKVEIYGSMTPMKQLANVGAPEPQQLVALLDPPRSRPRWAAGLARARRRARESRGCPPAARPNRSRRESCSSEGSDM